MDWDDRLIDLTDLIFSLRVWWPWQDGFTHATAKPELLLGVANHFYTGTSDASERLILCVCASEVAVGLKERHIFQCKAINRY